LRRIHTETGYLAVTQPTWTVLSKVAKMMTRVGHVGLTKRWLRKNKYYLHGRVGEKMDATKELEWYK